MPHLLISAAHKSSGKTTLSVGLCAAFRGRGLAVQPFKKGPDYIDPLWLSAAAGRACHNLDFYTMDRDEIPATFGSAMQGADLGIIEGNKGLYDGLDLDGSNSNAALATLLGAPVVLVINARGMTRGIAPLILGYQAFDRQVNIAGVILNDLGGYRHESKLRQVIEHYTNVPVLGAVHHATELQIVERHLGLMPANESERAAEQIDRIRDVVAEQVDLDRLLECAAAAAPIELPAVAGGEGYPAPDLRIGIARDAAFGFYYAGDLDALRHGGAELVPFDTLSDRDLPDVDGLFIGGGFPETRMAALEANARLRVAIRLQVERGMPVYAECGGLMYLARSLTWRGETCKMVGVLPADVVMHERPQGRGYVRLRETGNSPWPDPPVQELRAHEFHYSSLENLDAGLTYAYEVLRGTGIDGEHDGIVYRNLLASYTHLRDVGGNRWTRRFLDHVRRCTSGRTGFASSHMSKT